MRKSLKAKFLAVSMVFSLVFAGTVPETLLAAELGAEEAAENVDMDVSLNEEDGVVSEENASELEEAMEETAEYEAMEEEEDGSEGTESVSDEEVQIEEPVLEEEVEEAGDGLAEDLRDPVDEELVENDLDSLSDETESLESEEVEEQVVTGEEIGSIEEASDKLFGSGNDYPYNDRTYGTYRTQDIDPWRFYYRECTSFVAWCLNSRNGVEFTNSYGGVQWGHAKNWGYAAGSIGITVNNDPAIGSIWWSTAGDYGHVAWVSAVNGDDVTIEEYNHRKSYSEEPGRYGTRTLSKWSATGYIHIADISNPEPVFTPPTGTQTIADENYYIVSALGDDIALDVAGIANQSHGANVQICRNMDENNDIFSVRHQGNAYYTITHLASNKLLDVSGGSREPGVNAQIWGNYDGDAQ